MNPRRGSIRPFLIALAALAALASLPAAAGAAGFSADGPVSGIVRVHGAGARPFAPAAAGPLRPLAAAATASAGNVTYHGGPVMRTNTVYTIYWLPPGTTMSPGYQAVVNKYFRDVADASGTGTNVYSNDTQYYDTTGKIANSATFGGSYVDTANAIPMNDLCAAQYTAELTGCVTSSDEQAEIDRVLAATGWTPGPTKEFFLFTPQGVGSCFASNACAYKYYCAFHSSFASGGKSVIWANQPYPVPPAAGGGSCDIGVHPNGDVADAVINLASHEHIESITDPYGNAWLDAGGEEISDKCAWKFGTALGSTESGQYNQAIGTGRYYLQQEWSNATSSCVLRAPSVAPKVTGPATGSGRVGDEVTITGTSLDEATSVKFGSVADTAFEVDSPTQITAHVPDGALTGTIKVTSPIGTGTGPTYKVLPTISSLSAGSGLTGSSLTVTGRSLSGTTKVAFGASTATATIVSVTATSVKVTVPSSAVTGPVTVTNAGGSTASEGSFTVLPKLSSLTPVSPTSGGAGTAVTIAGSGLADATVTFAGGVVATPTSDTATKIVVPVPATAIAGPISIVTSGGSIGTAAFRPLPRLGTLEPRTAEDLGTLSLTGTNLLGATAVTLGGVALPFGVDSALAAHVTVPSTAVTGSLAITTPAGTATTTLKVLPTVDSFTPASAVAGTKLTLTGQALKSPTKVAFAGGAVATVYSSTATSATVYVPAGALDGPITVTTAGGSTTTDGSFTVVPTISATPAPATATTAVTISGSGITGATSVTFNGVSATVDSNTASKIVARVPASATVGAIVVVTPDGTATSPTPFKPLPKLAAPETVQAGDSLSLTGTNLLGATKLTLGGIAIPLDVDSALAAHTTVPSAAVTGTLTITTPGGTSSVTLRVRPTLDALEPESGRAGDQVIVTGNTLKSAKVKFGTIAATIVSTSATSVTFLVPAGAVTGPIAVTNAGGSTTSAGSFTVLT